MTPTKSALLATGVTAAMALTPVTMAQTQGPDRVTALRASLAATRVRNVILFIGDGMGDSEITLARYYGKGARGRLAMDSLPFTGSYTTWAVDEQQPALPVYVPDSAATGTAWATGTKTSNGRISTTPSDDRDVKTILEHARELGYRTGDVTTAELTDATPAVLAAHVSSRACQGPKDMDTCQADLKRAGGPGSIAEQLIAHDVDVLLGGGAARFDQQTDDGPTVAALAVSRGYRVIRSAADLGAAQRGTRLLGLFASGNMSTEWTGDRAAVYPSNSEVPQTCRPNTRGADEPTLADMTATALRLLEQPATAPRGFFLQVEGASIDKQDHQADPCGQIGETLGFDRAIQLGIDFATRHADTLIIVTADHGHTSQIVANPDDRTHPPGMISSLKTADGAVVTVSYGTNLPGQMQDHTGTQVRIAAMGPQGANVVGLMDQTDLFGLLLRALTGSSPQAARPPGR